MQTHTRRQTAARLAAFLVHKSHYRVPVNCGFTVCASRQRETEQTTSKHQHHITHSLGHELDRTSTHDRRHPATRLCTDSGGNRNREVRPNSPLSCMTTPKCVLGVLSSGALGGAETTGGLDGFLLEVVLFSVTGRKRSKRQA